MRALGSSLFLKNRFGVGYRLTMVKRSKKKNKKIEPYLLKHLGKCELMSEVSQEICFLLPKEQSKNFKDFFKQFDLDIYSLGIESYGVSITTLEEVFLKINQELRLGGEEVDKISGARTVSIRNDANDFAINSEGFLETESATSSHLS